MNDCRIHYARFVVEKKRYDKIMIIINPQKKYFTDVLLSYEIGTVELMQLLKVKVIIIHNTIIF